MPKTLDDKVVSIEFDNKKFEKNAKQTMSTIDKLKAKLRFNKENRMSDDINKEIENVDLSPMETALRKFDLKCSAFEIARITGIQRIVNAAITAGANITRQLTTVPVSTGFAEYEEKMSSVQTIMAGTGESLETVMDALEKLNVYADKTIYSFSDMTSNIGKFTNAGVKLQDAVDAIRGVSNVAAVSGANTNEASRAMYNLAQSLSAGYVKLIDWKSIENANMATVEFKENLLDTAAAQGSLKKVSNGVYKTLKGNTVTATRNFNETLQEQWLTTDALIKTLRDYADETTEIGKKAYAAAQDVKTLSMLFDTLKEAVQSGWGTTWELIIGDFEEAKSFLSEISNVFGDFIGSVANARNYLLMGGLGKQSNNWKKITNAVDNAGISVEEFNNSLIETGKRYVSNLDEIIANSGSFEESLKRGWLNSDIVTEVFKKFNDSLATTTKTYTEEQKSIIQNLYSSASESGGVVNNLLSNMDKYGKASGRENLLAGILNIFTAIAKLARSVGAGINAAFGKMNSKTVYEMTDRFQKFTKSLILSDDIFDKIARTVRGLASAFKLISDIFKTGLTVALEIICNLLGVAGEGLLGLTANLGDWITKTVQNIRANEELRSKLVKVVATIKVIATIIASVIKQLFSNISLVDAVQKALDVFLIIVSVIGVALVKIKELFGYIRDLNFDKIGEWFSSIFKGVGPWFSKVFSFIGSAALKLIGKLGEWFGDIFSKIGEWFSGIFTKENFGKIFNKNNLMGAALVSVMLTFVKKIKGTLADIFPKNSISDAFKNAGDFFKNVAFLVGAFALLSLVDFNQLKKVGDYLLSFTIKLTLIQKIFGTVSFGGEVTAKMLLAIVGIVAIVFALSKIGGKGLNASIVVLTILLGILFIIGMVLEIVKTIKSTAEVAKPLIDALGTSVKAIGKSISDGITEISHAIKVSILAGVVKQFAIAILIVAGAIALLSKLPIANVWSSLGAILMVVGAMIGVMQSIYKMDAKKFIKSAAGAIILASAVSLLAIAISTIKDGEAAIMAAVSISIIIGAMIVLIGALSLATKSGSITKAAGGFLILSIGVVLIANAVSQLGEIDGTRLILAAVSISIITTVLGGVIILLAVASKIGSVMVSAVAFVLLAASVVLIANALSKLGEIDGTRLILAATAISIIVSVVSGLTIAIAALSATGIGAAGILIAVVAIIGIAAGMQLMANAVMTAANAFDKFVSAAEKLPVILRIFFEELESIVTKSAENADKAYEAGTALLGKYIQGLIAGIDDNKGTFDEKLAKFMAHLYSVLNDKSYYTYGCNCGEAIMRGIASGITDGTSGVIAALNGAFDVIKTAVDDDINTLSGKIKGQSWKFQNSGVYLMQGLDTGLNNPAVDMLKWMFTFGTSMLGSFNDALDIHSPSGKMKESGQYIYDGLEESVIENLPKVAALGTGYGYAFVDSFNEQTKKVGVNVGNKENSSSGTKETNKVANSESSKTSNKTTPSLSYDEYVKRYGKWSAYAISREEYEESQKKSTKNEEKNTGILGEIENKVEEVKKALTGGDLFKSFGLDNLVNSLDLTPKQQYSSNVSKLTAEEQERINSIGEEINSAVSGASTDTQDKYAKYFSDWKSAYEVYNELASKPMDAAKPAEMEHRLKLINNYQKRMEDDIAWAYHYIGNFGLSKEDIEFFWTKTGSPGQYSNVYGESMNSFKDAWGGSGVDWSKYFTAGGDDKNGNDIKNNTDSILDALNKQNNILGSGTGSEKSYTFVQNNYSPKALSSVEIYRQTNNQLSRLARKGW